MGTCRRLELVHDHSSGVHDLPVSPAQLKLPSARSSLCCAFTDRRFLDGADETSGRRRDGEAFRVNDVELVVLRVPGGGIHVLQLGVEVLPVRLDPVGRITGVRVQVGGVEDGPPCGGCDAAVRGGKGKAECEYVHRGRSVVAGSEQVIAPSCHQYRLFPSIATSFVLRMLRMTRARMQRASWIAV